MTPAERAFWMRAHRRADGLAPELRTALLRAFEIIRESLLPGQLEQLVAAGAIDRLLTTALSEPVMTVAFRSVRDKIRRGVASNVGYFAREVPKGTIAGQLAVSFDVLAPETIEGIRQLETKVIQTLQSDVRETARAFVENGLRDGVSPRAIARQLREVIGLAPNQEAAVANFRRLLETGDREALSRALRDRRFDGVLERTLGPAGSGLTPEQIETQVSAYRRRMVAFNAETNARTASLDAMKLGHSLAWEDADRKGIVNLDLVEKTWRGVLDDRERPEHRAMEGQTVPFRSDYPNGQGVPGETDFNCRCLSIFRMKTA